MSVILITGDSGQNHVTAADDGELNAGIVSLGKVVLSTGKKLEAEIISNNLIRIHCGSMIDQGRQITSRVDDYEDVAIDNGNMGMNRNDIIAFHYEMNEQTLIEIAECKVIKGTPAAEAVDPDLDTGNILQGDSWDDAALYRVKLEGLNIVAVEPMFDILIPADQFQKETNAALAELNSNIQSGFFSGKKSGDVITLKHPVNVDSIVFPQPRYNTVATIRCNFSAFTIAAGENTFTLLAHDTETGNGSTSAALAGYYLVVPMG